MSHILVDLLYCNSGVRGGEPSSSGGVTGTIFIISGVGGGGPGGVRGPGGSADIGVLSRGERLRSSRLKWLGAFSSGEKRKNIGKTTNILRLFGEGPIETKQTNPEKTKNFGRTKKRRKTKAKKNRSLGDWGG